MILLVPWPQRVYATFKNITISLQGANHLSVMAIVVERDVRSNAILEKSPSKCFYIVAIMRRCTILLKCHSWEHIYFLQLWDNEAL